ncbi:MAG: 4Fe-4S binding protein [Eggerthellaceae bacterium]|nr:4Fe-4S binding protein [Eggerthellaceae bacterium]
MKRVYALEAWCIDCKRCEVACKTFHSRSKDTIKAFKYEKPVPQSRIVVEGTKQLSVAVNCRHCDEPKCVEGCISGAMTKNPVTGLVTSNPEKCVGCRSCVSMCPYGCVWVAEYTGKDIAYKCDLCTEDMVNPGNPRCVAVCPNRALIYVESAEC